MVLASALPATGTWPAVTLEKKAPKSFDAVIIGVLAGEEKGEIQLPVTEVLSEKDTTAVLESLLTLGAKASAGEINKVVLGDRIIVAVGLGAPEELDDETLRRSAGSAARTLASLAQEDETLEVVTTLNQFGMTAVVEGFILGGYHYPGLTSKENNRGDVSITILTSEKEAKTEYVAAQITAESVNWARDIVNTPSSHKAPATYAEFLSSEAKKAGLEVKVYDEKELEKNNFGGILAVGAGSNNPPRLVHLKWAPRKGKKNPKVGLVGKGITFDTGGISLKPAAKMENMISDMGGSAAVAGTMLALARLDVPIEVDAWLPLAENMPSGTATRPGDVITHYGGLTSEIINTDAEGRLVLADAIARASEEEPAYLIETSTLTGAQMVALGARTAGVMGSEEFRDTVAETGRNVGEHAWAMPLLEEQEEELKSPVADMRNSHNARTGGMLFAGLYLEQFVGEDIEWAHIDIAGPSFNEGSARGYTPKRATGTPLRTILAVVRSLAENSYA